MLSLRWSFWTNRLLGKALDVDTVLSLTIRAVVGCNGRSGRLQSDQVFLSKQALARGHTSSKSREVNDCILLYLRTFVDW